MGKKRWLVAIALTLVATACDRSAPPTPLGPEGLQALPATSASSLTVTKAELTGTRLRVEGSGAAPGSSILIDGSAMGTADSKGNFRVERDPFSSPSCVITVSDGTGSTEATLSGCTPSAPPPPGGPAAPSLVSPAEGAQLVQPITLSWSDVTAEQQIIVYNWQVSTSSGFASVIAWGQTIFPAEGTPPPTQDMLSGLPGGIYFWRVQAVERQEPHSLVQGPWSTPRSFTITGSAPGTPGAPTITAPAPDSRFHPGESFDVNWTSVPGADHYLYEYDDEPSFSYPLANTSSGRFDGTTITHTFGFEATFWARVRAVNAEGVRGLPSAAVRFVITYDAPLPPPPALLSPAAGAQLSVPVTFDWTDVPNPQIGGYELQIDDEPSYSGDCGLIEMCIRSITPSEHTISSLSAGTKYWRVRSYQGNSSPTTAAVTAWSEVRSFTVSAAPPTLIALSLSQTSTFSGSPVSGDNPLGQVQLSSPAPAGGTVVTLTSSNPTRGSARIERRESEERPARFERCRRT